MTNPPGPINSTPPNRPSEPARPGTDRFQELMKVGQSDEKQKKKKKQRQEVLEDKKAQVQASSKAAQKIVEAQKAAKFPKAKKTEKTSKTDSPIKFEPASSSSAPIPSPTSQTHPSSKSAASQQKPPENIAPVHRELEQNMIIKEDKKDIKANSKETKKIEPSSVLPPVASPLDFGFLTPTAEIPPAYTLLSPTSFALFEKMVSTILVLENTGIKETTIHLNTTEFANSYLENARIIIREYSSAPLAYNIELVGNPEAAAFFQKNLSLLRSAFDEKKGRYRVNRLDSSIADDHPRVERKQDAE